MSTRTTKPPSPYALTLSEKDFRLWLSRPASLAVLAAESAHYLATWRGYHEIEAR